MISSIIVIISMLMGLATFSAYLLIRLPIRYWLKWILVPAVFVIGFYLSHAIPDLMGRAYPNWPKNQFTYLDHRVLPGTVDGDKRGKHVEVWALLKDGSSRVYSIPFDAEITKKLDEAKADSVNGTPVKGEFHKHGSSGQSGVGFDLDIDPQIDLKSLLPPKGEPPTDNTPMPPQTQHYPDTIEQDTHQ